MKTDVRDIQPGEGEIPFSDTRGNEYSIPESIPSGCHLEILEKWDDLMPFMMTRGMKVGDTPEAVENRAEVFAKADKAIRSILHMMARDAHPFMTPEWFKENLDGLELMALSTEILMQASSFFVKRQQKLARLERKARAITAAAEGR